MNRQYPRNAIPKRAGLQQPARSQVYNDMVDADDYSDEEEYDDQWPPPTPRSAIRYTTEQPVVVAGNRRYVLHNRLPQPTRQDIPQPQLQPRPQPQVRRVAPPPPQPEYDDKVDEIPARQRPRRRLHAMFILGVGMIIMLLLRVGGSMLVAWWNVTQDDWHYGRPRTFHDDA